LLVTADEGSYSTPQMIRIAGVFKEVTLLAKVKRGDILGRNGHKSKFNLKLIGLVPLGGEKS
jgi:hypothetical protein